MKNLVAFSFILILFQFPARLSKATIVRTDIAPTENIFIITLDGFRWQEVFGGADPKLLSNEKYTYDTTTMKMLYGAPDAEGRRKKLLPFFWNVVGKSGQLFGNRNYGNCVNVANAYAISYPGYNEIFTGYADPHISSNGHILNPNKNVLESLNAKPGFNGKVAAFASWDLFPFILNKERSSIILNSGHEDMVDNDDPEQSIINKVQDNLIDKKEHTRRDLLTFLIASEYIEVHHPRIVFLGLGETDEAAHQSRYDLYLEKATDADRMIGELWNYVQTTPGYRNNTTFIITTDHGRGNKSGNWPDHGMFISGSSQTWIAVLGPSIKPIGELKDNQQVYQRQLAETIATLIGEKFRSENPE
jgi:hypothetical protein